MGLIRSDDLLWITAERIDIQGHAVVRSLQCLHSPLCVQVSRWIPDESHSRSKACRRRYGLSFYSNAGIDRKP